jgi:pimeloyl-ACP methyl ester carboxylesterase
LNLLANFHHRNIRTEVAVMGKSAATIVLVHGAWADGSSWNRVIPLLQTKDLPVIAVQIPLTSLENDLAATSRIVADTKGPIVLVGHSWGGVAITQAGADPKVAALLVYVSAFLWIARVGAPWRALARPRRDVRQLDLRLQALPTMAAKGVEDAAA